MLGKQASWRFACSTVDPREQVHLHSPSALGHGHQAVPAAAILDLGGTALHVWWQANKSREVLGEFSLTGVSVVLE